MLVSRGGDADFVKILDFGLAKLAPEAQDDIEGEGAERVITRHGSVFGTPRYMAPEQCLGESVDSRSDLYALGLIVYEALTGCHPFDERNPRRMLKHHLFTPIPLMKTRAPAVTVPESLDALVATHGHARGREIMLSLLVVVGVDGIIGCGQGEGDDALGDLVERTLIEGTVPDGGDDGHWQRSCELLGRRLGDERLQQRFLAVVQLAADAFVRCYDGHIDDLAVFSPAAAEAQS